MGTDFSNDDLVKQSSIIEDFTHLLDGDSIILNRRCWKLILTAKEEAAVVWGKMEIWIDQKDYLQLCTNFYDEDGYLINVMQVKEIQKMGGRVIPKIMEMYPADEKDKKTIMSYNSIVFDAQLPVNIFSLNQIKQLRD
jgi:outer membrane lipoprotein-sorting protein